MQTHFDSLPDAHRDEILDLLGYLQNAIQSLWRRPEFDPLDGEYGISEIRPADIRDDEGVTYYRIYGYFGPCEGEYTFLHLTAKRVKNDRDGKKIARERLDRIRCGKATVHKFEF